MGRSNTPEPAPIISRRLAVVILLLAAIIAVVLMLVSPRRVGDEPAEPPAAPPIADVTPLPRIPFTDITREAGIDFVHRGGATGEKMLPESGGSGCALFDYNNDGRPDLLLLSGKAWPWDEDGSADGQASVIALYRNNGDGTFTDVTAEVGLALDDFYAQGAAVGDYDGDGFDDLFITGVGGNRMFRNEAGRRFIDVTDETGLAGSPDDWTTSAGFFDSNGDGRLDLFVCNYVQWTREADQGAVRRVPGTGLSYAHPESFHGTYCYLYQNNGDGTFTDVSAAAGIHVDDPATGKPAAKALAVTFADIDGDGLLDILVANDTVRHFLFRNRGDGTFEEVAESVGFALNADGWATSGMSVDAAWLDEETLAVAIGNFAEERTSFYIVGRDGATVFLTDESVGKGIGGPTRDMLTWGLAFDDFDLDGRVEMVQANGHLEETIHAVQPSQQYAQRGQLFWNRVKRGERPAFVELPDDHVGDLAQPIVGRALAVADIDGDGDLDLVITGVGGPPLLLRNDQQQGHNWLRVRLEGPAGNHRGIGASVELSAGGVTQRRTIMPTRSYLAQTEPVATFGLDDVDAIERLVVNWPDGARQQVTPDGVNQTITIRRADAADEPVEADADSFITLANLAKAQLEIGRFEESAANLLRALAIRPASLPLRRNLARAFVLSGQPEKALDELRRLEEMTEEPSAGIAYLMGLAELRQLNYEEAATHFRRALELDPHDATFHFQLALALTALGRSDEAKGHFEETAELNPLHGGAQYQLATIARREGDQEAFAQYMRDFQRIRELRGPTDPLAFEQNAYTVAEAAESIEPRVAETAELPSQFRVAEPLVGADGDAFNLLATAVLSIDESGRYELVGVTARGEMVLFGVNEAGRAEVIARSEPLLPAPEANADLAESAVVLVGNALRNPIDRDQEGEQPEIAVVTPRGSWLLRYRPEHGFENLTETSGLAAAAGHAARWVDLDHDGDIDLCVAGANGLQVWRNNSDGRFVESTDDFGLSHAANVLDFAAADFDGTNLGVDLVLVGPDGAAFYRNQFAGRLAAEAETARQWPAAERVLADDFSNDGLPELVFLAPDQATLVNPASRERQQLPLNFQQIDAATTIDVDNNGWLDVAIFGRTATGPAAVLLRNVGGRFAEAFEPLPGDVAVRPGGVLDFELDGSGRTDLFVIDEAGRPIALLNETPTSNRQLKLALHSFVGHPSSIGVRVQVRRENHVVSRWTNRELPIEIGMGTETRADSIQTLWTNGVVNNELRVPLAAAPVRITIIEFVRTGSCPFLYVWADGAWEFVTDVLGTAPWNVAVARGVPMPADPDELVVLGPAERLADGDAAARLRITTELREVIYLEEVRLLAIDHPEGTTIFSRDRAAPTAIDGKQFAVGRAPLALRSAVGDDGVDRTAALARLDDVFAPPGRVLPPPLVGFTEPLAIEFDFGDLDDAEDWLLALTGWFRFGSSSTNIAASQHADIEVIWPRLEVLGRDGEWRLVEEMVGIPAGNTKTIVCDLAGKLPAGATRFRLTTSLEVRWDHFALYRAVDPQVVRVTEVGPSAAELGWHGFAELRPTGPDHPQEPNLARMSDRPVWLTAMEGWCTRYGDVLPLVAAADGRMAVLNSGDGATLEFPRSALPSLPPDSSRTLAVYTRGWIKEGDPNSLPDRGVEPLPASAIDWPDDAGDWQLEYNTRWVPRDLFLDKERTN